MKKNHKKIVYISLFVLLGILLQFLVHAGVEIWYIGLLVGDFEKYGFGLTWSDWYLIHYIYTVFLLILGVVFGLFMGKYGWKRIYEKS